MDLIEQNARRVFAEELEREGARGLAEMVRSGHDNSTGGTAAVRAMLRLLRPMPYRLTFDDLREAMVARDSTYRNRKGELVDCKDWSPADWLVALIGEVGEACNLLKKVRRGDLTLNEARPELTKEFGDVQAYLDHWARHLGIDLGCATRDKFNEISERIGSPVRVPVKHNVVVVDGVAREHNGRMLGRAFPPRTLPGDERPDLKHDWSVRHEPRVCDEDHLDRERCPEPEGPGRGDVVRILDIHGDDDIAIVNAGC